MRLPRYRFQIETGSEKREMEKKIEREINWEKDREIKIWFLIY